MNWDVGGGSFASVSICTAMAVARWSLVLLAMVRFPSSEECISVSSSKDDATEKRLYKKLYFRGKKIETF